MHPPASLRRKRGPTAHPPPRAFTNPPPLALLRRHTTPSAPTHPPRFHASPTRTRQMTGPTLPPQCTTTRPNPSPHTPLLPHTRRDITPTKTVPHAPPPPPSPPPPTPPSPALSMFVLTLVTILWGTQHSIIKLSVDHSSLPPSVLTFLRFSLASVVTLPFLPSFTSLKDATRLQWRHGLEQSLWMFAGYAMQAVALQTTTATRSGFLLYLNVKFVPLLARVVYGRAIGVGVWISAAVALVGTVLLTYDGMTPVIGDAWSVGAALASAMFILRLEKATEHVEAGRLSAMTIVGVAVLSGLWSGVEFVNGGWAVEGGLVQGWEAWAGVVYLGVVTTAVSNYLQAVGQRGVRAERAAVVYAMDPVYGAAFAAVLLGEGVGRAGLVGGGLVTAAAVWSAVAASGKEEREGR